MKNTIQAVLLALLICGVGFAERPAKPAVSDSESTSSGGAQWKGKPYDHTVQFSAMPGIGLLGSQIGFALNGAIAFKILHQGFLDDVNDQVYIEVMGGPVFYSTGTGGDYSAHMRWDFHKNDFWSFYALGGFGGMLPPGGGTTFHPRFGVGALWNLFEFLSFRAELSHEFTGVGVVYLL